MIYKRNNILNIPNIISLIRLLLSPFLFLIIGLRGGSFWFIIPIFLLLILISDIIDGSLARSLPKKSRFGKLFDVVADKFFILMLFGSLSVNHGFPAFVILIIVIRDILVLGGNLILMKLNKRQYVLQNIWEKISMFTGTILFVIASLETIWSMTTTLSIVFVLVNVIIIIISLVHFLAEYTITILPKKLLPLKVVSPILIIAVFLIFVTNWFVQNYIKTHTDPTFYNENAIKTDINKSKNETDKQSDEWMNIDKNKKSILVLGPALGRMSSDSLIVWVVTENEETLDLIVYDDKKKSNIIYETVIETKKDRGFTGYAQITGLSPETTYYYDIQSNIAKVGVFRDIIKTDKAYEMQIPLGKDYDPEKKTNEEEDSILRNIEKELGIEDKVKEIKKRYPEDAYYYGIETIYESVIDEQLKDYTHFTTFPEDNQDFSTMRFMVTSGHKPLDTSIDDYYHSPVVPYQFRMWEALSRHIKMEHFDFLLLIGDQVYNDAPFEDTMPTKAEYRKMLEDEKYKIQKEKEVRNAYRRNYINYWKFHSMRKVMASTPSFMIWDDHEMIDGWGSDKSHKDEITQFMIKQGIEVYNEFQDVFNPEVYEDSGKYYFHFDYGKMGFFVPDLRLNRDITKPYSEYPLMGKEQWDDFKTWLISKDTLKKDSIFIGLSVPLVAVPNWITDWLSETKDGIGDDMRDRWFYKKNRPEMLKMTDYLFEYQNKTDAKAYTMGGDIHVSLLSRIINKNHNTLDKSDAYLYEFSSSGISNEDSATQSSYALFKTIYGNNKISAEYYSQVMKIVGMLNYGVVEASRINEDYDIKYYVAFETENTPNSVGYRLMYSSYTQDGFPAEDIKIKHFYLETPSSEEETE